MAIKYLGGRRMQGTAAERTALNLTSPPQTSWKELGRTTLSSTGDAIDVSNFAAKDNLMILQHGIPSGDISSRLRFNSDTGSNYAQRGCRNGGSEATSASRTNVSFSLNPGNASDEWLVANVVNEPSKEKLWITHGIDGTAGAGNDPNRSEISGVWRNTSNAITSVNVYHTEGGDYAAGSECVVLGCDNDEADSGTNFWQELASTTLTSTANEINSGTFTAKKYLWIELNVIADGSISGSDLQFNEDTGSNYARRYSNDGASDDTGTSESTLGGGTGGNYGRNHWFIVNKANREKMAIGQAMWGSTGAANNPSARALTGKWANTSNQITSIKVKENGSGGWASGSILKVWGAD